MSLMGESETWEDFWRLGSPEWNEESHFRKDEHWQKTEGKNEHVTFERQEEDERDMLRAKKGSVTLTMEEGFSLQSQPT